MFARLVAAAAATALLAVVSPAHAQSGKAEWDALVAKAKGQTFSAAVAPDGAFLGTLTAFGKKFGVNIEPTVARPSQHLARIQTEQRSGQFVWDLWMGGTSNMVNSASPAGLLEPIEKYFLLPEVKDPTNWRHPDFIFNDSRRSVFAVTNKVEYYTFRNTTVLPEIKLATWDEFADPRLKGKIGMRDLSVPNAGAFSVATMLGAKGGDFVRKIMKEQDVKVFENPQQLETTLNRGAIAVALGLETSLWDKCRADGGCKHIDRMDQFRAATSTGMSIPKNPPHPDVVKLWVNWFLSKEGQDIWVNTWAATSPSGAVSMRKDVPPVKGHEDSLPDFTQTEKYIFVSSERGSEEIEETIKIFKEVVGK
jgi:ABC-type Fe3+ transport system substrate-binding protein